MINMLLEISLVILAVIVIVSTGVGIYYYVKKQNQKTDMKIRSLIDQINGSNFYSYNYDKSQEKNIMNLEDNITNINDTLTNVKDNVEYISNNVLTKENIAKNVKTDKLEIGPNILTNYASADGNNWLYANGGLDVAKLKVNKATELNGTAKVTGDVSIKGTVNMTKNLIINGDMKNKWITHVPDDGRTNMYIAPGSGTKWNWDKQFVYDKDGYLSVYGGGINLRGGSSIYNPNKLGTHFPYKDDGKNYISGDTHLRGDMTITGTVQIDRGDPGPMIEKRYTGGDNNRYGIGQFENGTLRMYTASSYMPATLNLSLAKPNGQFDDIVKMKTDRSLEVNGIAKFNQPIQANTIQFSPGSSINKFSNTLRMTIDDTKNEMFEVIGASNGRKLATVTSSGLLCLGDTLCMKENKGTLQVCDNKGINCKSVQVV